MLRLLTTAAMGTTALAAGAAMGFAAGAVAGMAFACRRAGRREEYEDRGYAPPPPRPEPPPSPEAPETPPPL